MDFSDIIDLFIAAKTRKKCFKWVSCYKDLLAILDFILIYFWTKNYFAVISILKKILFFQFLRLLHFQMPYIMNTKLRFQAQ